jgi:hypothetical protein
MINTIEFFGFTVYFTDEFGEYDPNDVPVYHAYMDYITNMADVKKSCAEAKAFWEKETQMPCIVVPDYVDHEIEELHYQREMLRSNQHDALPCYA